MNKISDLLILILAALLWEFLSRWGIFNIQYFPPPTSIFLRLFNLLQEEKFLLDIMASLWRLIIGVIIAVPLSVTLALTMNQSKLIHRLVTPVINVTYPIPRIAIFPLFMVFFGIGDASKVAVITLGIFYLLLLQLQSGLNRLRMSHLIDVACVYRVRGFELFIKVILRGILPEFLIGLKAGLGYGLVMVVASEFTASRDGIGLFMWNAWDQFRIIDLYSGLFIIGIIGHIIFSSLDIVVNNLPETKYSSHL